MERPRISDGRDGTQNITQDIIKEDDCQTVVLPLMPKKRRTSRFKRLFFLFLIVFFVFCVWLTVQKLFSDGQLAAEAFTEFFVKQGVGMSK